MRIYKSANPFPHRKRSVHIFHKNRRYSFGFQMHPYSSSASTRSVICFEIFCFKIKFATTEFPGLNESASRWIAEMQIHFVTFFPLVTSSFGKTITCFLQESVIPFIINSFSFFVGLNRHRQFTAAHFTLLFSSSSRIVRYFQWDNQW